MLTERETEALLLWYRQERVLAESGRLIEAGEWEELEEHLHMRCLIPLHRHSELPAFMKDEAGQPLFPSNLNPGMDLERWRDAIEVGWRVVEEEFGLSRDEVHRRIAREQEEDWASFLRRFEARKR